MAEDVLMTEERRLIWWNYVVMIDHDHIFWGVLKGSWSGVGVVEVGVGAPL